jgi:hypothetical protein
VELAAALGAAQPGGLTLAGITAVFTIDYVAEMLGEDVEWLHELSQDMDPEDGCLWVYGVGEDGVVAFTNASGSTASAKTAWSPSPSSASSACRSSSPICAQRDAPHRPSSRQNNR